MQLEYPDSKSHHTAAPTRGRTIYCVQKIQGHQCIVLVLNIQSEIVKGA